MKKTNIISTMYSSLVKSINSLRISFKLFFTAVFLDLIFFFIFGFFKSSYFSKIQEYLYAIGTLTISGSGIKTGIQDNFSFISLFVNSYTIRYFLILLLLYLLYMFTFYFIFCFIFGLSIYISINLNNFSVRESVIFVKNFYKITIKWFVLWFFFNIIIVILSLKSIKLLFGISESFLKYFGMLFILFFFYFAYVSVFTEPYKNLRKTIIIAIKNFLRLFPAYLTAVFFYLFLDWTIPKILGWNRIFLLSFGVLIILSYLCFAKLFLFKVYISAKKENN